MISSGLVFIIFIVQFSISKSSTVTYSLVKSGKCTDVDNSIYLSDIASCNAAADSLRYSDKDASEMSGDYWPPGCLWLSGEDLYFNTYSASTKSCTETYPCICITAPACADGDNAATCICGDSGVCMGSGARSTGMVCDAETSTCSRPTNCLNTDGLVKNAASCACGSADCASEEYCIAHVNGCSQYAQCSVTDGSDVASVDCACGSVDCKAGDYCHYGTEDWLTQWGVCKESDGQLC